MCPHDRQKAGSKHLRKLQTRLRQAQADICYNLLIGLIYIYQWYKNQTTNVKNIE
jgi:hypothetical protein